MNPSTFVCVGFCMADILPGECMDKKDGIYYIVMPIHYRELCIGYCVVGNDHKKVEQRFIQHLVLNINNALGEIREYEIMQTMFANINEKWMYDELTGDLQSDRTEKDGEGISKVCAQESS